jgi:acylphosphatase
MEMQRVKFLIKGLVQGVGYRYYVLREASLLNLKGYTKNDVDGTVEVVVEGEKDVILQFHKLLKQGPSRAHVEQCLVEELEFTGEFERFFIY